MSPSSEYSGLISCRIDWLDLLAVQGTLKSLLQQHSSKASTLQHSAFFMVQLSHPDMTTRKTIALTRQTFVLKVRSLLFSMLCRFVRAFLPTSKHLLISWLQSPSTVGVLKSRPLLLCRSFYMESWAGPARRGFFQTHCCPHVTSTIQPWRDLLWAVQ